MSRAAEHGARSFALIWSQNSRVDHEHDAAGGGALGAPPDVEIAAVARGPPMMTRRKQPRCVLQRLRARGRVGGAMYHNARGVHPHACPCARTDAVERKRATHCPPPPEFRTAARGAADDNTATQEASVRATRAGARAWTRAVPRTTIRAVCAHIHVQCAQTNAVELRRAGVRAVPCGWDH
jgi:hypothetical protein